MRYVTGILISLLLLVAASAFSQKASLIRIEIPAALESGAFQVEAIGKDGMLIFYESNEMTEDNLRKWYFGLFDTKLDRKWIKFVTLRDNIHYIKSVRNGRKVHFLFRSAKTSPVEGDFYVIVNYDIAKQAFSNISGTIPKDAEINGFEAIGNTGCLGINLKKYGTDVLFINLGNGEIKAQTLEPENDSYIETVGADPENKHFYVALKYADENRNLNDKLYRFSAHGEEQKTFTIAGQEGLKILRNFIFLPVKDNKLTIFGTYDMPTGKTMNLKDLEDDEEARGVGIFMLRYENDAQTMLKYYDFLSFENISGSFSGREVSFSKKKDGKEGEQKVKNLTAFYHFLAPEVKKKDGQYIFSVEIYKPVYKMITQMEYDFYGRPVPQTYSVFDGYTFYDFILAGIAPDGALVWNNDFELKDMRSYFLKPHVALFEDNRFLSMAYVSKGKLHSKTIDGSLDINEDEVSLETQFPKDRVTEDENNSIVHWYDNYFLVYGYQRLKNRTMNEQPVRTVFFANKVAYN
jgi:hypothetical protein